MGKRTKHDDGTQSEHDVIAAREERLGESQRERTAHHGHPASPDPVLLSSEGYSSVIEHEAARADNGMTAAKYRADYPGSRQPMPAATDQEREPAGNHPSPRRSELAAGHMVSDSIIGSPDSGAVLNLHTVTPSDQVRIQWDANESQAVGIGSALRQHIAGHANVSALDQARAADGGNMRGQLGDRSPMGHTGMDRHRIPTGTVGNYPGQSTGDAPRPVESRPGMSDPTANTAITAATNRDYARPFHPPAPNRAPGSEWTSRVPGAE